MAHVIIPPIGFSETEKKLVEFSIEENAALRKKIRAMGSNVFLTVKTATENDEFPLGEKLAGITKLTLLNFAGTTFLSGEKIAQVYENNKEYAKWFQNKVQNGELEVNFILNDPHSFAAWDAAKHKMRPSKKKVGSYDEIIIDNINTVLEFRKQNPKANIKLFLTQICLPYGIMLGENESNPEMDYMKVDLYSPLSQDDSTWSGLDDERPSFFLLRENLDTKEMYSLFKRVVERVQSYSKYTKLCQGPDVEWLTQKPIIHRGMFSKGICQHSVKGYLKCIRNDYPIEVDILFLKDGTPIVGRDVQLTRKINDCERTVNLSALTLKDLRSDISDQYIPLEQSNVQNINELLTFPEFLSLIDGRTELLIELKIKETAKEKELKEKASKVIDILRYYSGRFAIHSANPEILKEIRQLDRTIPLGQISWSFCGVDVSPEFREMHQNLGFINIIEPDFISYKLSEIPGNNKLIELCNTRKLPLLAWTVYNVEDELKAENCCDNIIIEGATSYLS